MKVTHKHTIYLDRVQSNIYIDAMQDDAYTRVLEFTLYSGGTAWNVPDGVSVAVAYSGASGKGIYDTLPDGSAACAVDGNVVTAVVAPQALSMSGDTELTVVFDDGNGKQLATFCVTLKVQKNPAVNATNPPDYINLRQWMGAELPVLLEELGIGPNVCVTITTVDGALTADKTFAELYAAHEAGQTIYCKMAGGDELSLMAATTSTLLFQGHTDMWYQRVSISSDNAIVCRAGQFVRVEDLGNFRYVAVSMQEDGTHTTNKAVGDIKYANSLGYPVVCTLAVGDVYISLPLVRCDDTAVFTGIYEGSTYTVTITADEVTVERSEVGSGGLNITDDGDGNVTITATGAVSITDDGEGNVTIA